MGSDNIDRDGYAPRAQKGGAIGANGEFYKGGQFVANSENTTKGGGARWEPRPKSDWEIARDAEIADRVAAFDAWLAARVAQFSALLVVLESEPQGVFETFWQSLARQLRQEGRLSPKQAHHAAKAIHGRRVKANGDAFDQLVADLSSKED